MKRMESRVVALEQRPRPPCPQCADWFPTVVVEGIDTPLPSPTICSSCGRQVIRLIREYREGDPKPRKDEPDGGGL